MSAGLAYKMATLIKIGQIGTNAVLFTQTPQSAFALFFKIC